MHNFQRMPPRSDLNGAPVLRRCDTTIIIRLPRHLWRRCDGCSCSVCKRTGRSAYWDAVAVARDALRKCTRADTTWTVHFPDPDAYDYFDVVELDEQGNASKYSTNARPEGPGYWTLLIPWALGTPTEWHPTESTGPFATLSRGTFETEDAAHKWAEERLAGYPYRIQFHVSYPEES